MSFRLLINVFLLLWIPVIMISCSTPKSTAETIADKDSSWYAAKQWLNDIPMTPHESIDQQEFSRQYHLYNKWWDEAFNFIKTHDLAEIAPGTYIIDSNNVYAMIMELNPNEKEQVKWEAHKNFNDLQFIIKGKAGMGIAPVTSPTTKVTMPYDAKTDNENFSVTEEKYYDAAPGIFFIFSPKDAHRPAFKIKGYDTIKKIVIKVRVPK